MPYAIGIDVGTTNSKVVLCELPSCRALTIEKIESPRFVNGSDVDYDVNTLVSGIVDLIYRCVCFLGDESKEIAFVSIASVGESGVLVYPGGSFDNRSIFWFDRRGESFVREVYERCQDEWLYGVTGVPPHSNSALFKILWLRENGASLKGATWLPLADFLSWCLTDSMGLDETLASRTSALDMRTGTISKEVLRHWDLPQGLFPDVVSSGTSRGRLSDVAVRATGLPSGCVVCVTGHDHMSGSVACGLRGDEFLNSTGTSEGILTINQEPQLDADTYRRQITNGRYVFDGQYTKYASVPAAGLSFQCMLKTLGIKEGDFFERGQGDLYEGYLQGVFDACSLVYVPHLRGSGPPRRNPQAKGLVYGLSDSTSREEIEFGVHLGVCLELRNLYEGMGCPPGLRAKVIGPAIHNKLWMQLKADVLGIEVEACNISEAVARGSVMLSATKQGLDAHLDYERETYVPDRKRAVRLEGVFKELYQPISSLIASIE